jgi:hypothetical protein
MVTGTASITFTAGELAVGASGHFALDGSLRTVVRTSSTARSLAVMRPASPTVQEDLRRSKGLSSGSVERVRLTVRIAGFASEAIRDNPTPSRARSKPWPRASTSIPCAQGSGRR